MSRSNGAATLEKRPTLRLIIPRGDAVLHITKLIEDGQAIRGQRIRSAATLDSARELKAQWSARAVELMTQMFGDSSIGEETMAWVGKILPEFAAFGAFVEQFHEEMDHHLKNLASMKKVIEKKPSPSIREATAAASAEGMVMTPPPPTPAISSSMDRPIERPATPFSVPTPMPQISPIPTPATPPQPAAFAPARTAQPSTNASKGMLVLHGDSSSASTNLREFVQSLGLVLVCAQSSEDDNHRAAISALEDHDDFAFALVLIDGDSDDDESAALGFELGYCVGRLGLGRVCALHPRGREPFMDSHGILHLPLDGAGGWQLNLARHFKRSGINLDLNKLC